MLVDTHFPPSLILTHSLPQDHTRFCNIVRFSPDGNLFCTGGSDGQAFLYDGKTGDKIGSLGAKAHDGSVYTVSYTNYLSLSLSLLLTPIILLYYSL